MAQIGQYQLGSFASPVNGGALDANVVRGNDNAVVGVHDNHDNDPTIHVQSFPFASLPSASTLGRFLIANDTYRAYFDTGSVLQEIAYLSKSGGAITGNLTISGTLGVGGTVTVSNGDGNFTHTSTNSQVSVNSSGGSGRSYAMISRTAGDFAIRDVSASADRIDIAAGGATSILAALTVTGAILPASTATFDLGATGTRWNSLFLAAGVVMGGSISGATTGAFSGAVSVGSLTGDVTGAITVATGTAAAGKIYKTAANGLVVQGATGSSNDLLLTSPANVQIAVVPTGSNNVNFSGTLRGAKVAGLSTTPTVGIVATGIATATLSSSASDTHGVLTITTDNVGGSIALNTVLATVTYSGSGYTFAPSVTLAGQGGAGALAAATFYQAGAPSTSFLSIVCNTAIPRSNTVVYVNYQVLGA